MKVCNIQLLLKKKQHAGFELQNFLVEMEDIFNKLSLICFKFLFTVFGEIGCVFNHMILKMLSLEA